MVIETKYNIGDRVWVVDEVTNGEDVPYEIEVYSEEIRYISYENELIYHVGEGCVEFREDEVIPYENLEKLAKKIKEIDDRIILGERKDV